MAPGPRPPPPISAAAAGAGLAGAVLLRLAVSPVTVLGVPVSARWLLVLARLALRLALGLALRIARLTVSTVVCLYAWRFAKLLWNVLTSKKAGAQEETISPETTAAVCRAPRDWKHQPLTQQATLDWLAAHGHAQLADLANAGSLVVLQPRQMLAQAMQEQGMQPGAPPALTEADAQLLARSRRLSACLAAPVPDALVLVGTVHVSQQSAQDVTRVIQELHPSIVMLELCGPRMEAMLVQPYADPLHDLEPDPSRLQEQAEGKNKTTLEILRAALSSRDQDILTTVLTGLYSKLEVQLKLRAGVEFIAARAALIQQLAADGAAGPGGQPATWLDRCVHGDRPVRDTLLSLWDSLTPLRRLRFLFEIGSALLSKIDEETIAELANEDVVELLLQEFSDAFPELLDALLHHRNFMLATNAWRAAQTAEALPRRFGCAARPAGPPGPVVAVVGKGHLGGMAWVLRQLLDVAARAGGRPIALARPGEGQQQPAADGQQQQQQQQPTDGGQQQQQQPEHAPAIDDLLG